jgi:hypothetical protein
VAWSVAELARVWIEEDPRPRPTGIPIRPPAVPRAPPGRHRGIVVPGSTSVRRFVCAPDSQPRFSPCPSVFRSLPRHGPPPRNPRTRLRRRCSPASKCSSSTVRTRSSTSPCPGWRLAVRGTFGDSWARLWWTARG